MVDDYYNEQEQWENVKRWLRENGLWLLAGVMIGVIGLVGWRWWEQRVETRAVAASDQYTQIIEAFQRQDRTRAFTLIDQLMADYPESPYAEHADLVAARANVEAEELPKAAERLTRVMSTSADAELRLVARARLARVQLAQGNADQAVATLAGAPAGAFSARFDEVRGDALLQKGDRSGALAAYRKARAEEGGGVIDVAAVDLKIADLLADGVNEPKAANASTNTSVGKAAVVVPSQAAPNKAAP